MWRVRLIKTAHTEFAFCQGHADVEAVPKRQAGSIQGSDADLRRLGNEAAGKLLVKFGVTPEEIAGGCRKCWRQGLGWVNLVATTCRLNPCETC